MATTRLLSAMVATWNNVATTFTGLKLNVTDTASAAGSLLADLQVGGASKFTLSKAGYGFFQSSLETGANLNISTNSGLIRLGTSSDVILTRDAANTLALRNGTAAQAFNVYNTYTDASNYERGYARWNAGVYEFGMEALGTGATKHVRLNRATGANLYLGDWIDNSSGHFLASVDNTFDIGVSGANRPRHVYTAGNLVAAGALFTAGSKIAGQADGVFRFSNNAGTQAVDLTIGASNLLTLNGGLFASYMTIGSTQAYNISGRGGLSATADGVYRLSNSAATNSVDLTVGASNLLTLNGGLKTTGATFALQTATTLTDNAAAQVATMTNGPAAGNPTKWIAINDNGVTRYIPAW